MPLSFRLSIVYASMCLFMGIYLPFFPVWLESKGLGPEAISLVIAGTLFPRVVSSPFFAFLADRWQSRRTTILALVAGSFVTVLILAFAEGFWAIFLLSLVLMALLPSAAPMVESIAMRATYEQGVDYGRVRIWCSLTFIGASTGAGYLLDIWPSQIVVYGLIGALVIHFAGMTLLPPDVAKGEQRTPSLLRFSAVRRLLAHPLFLIFLGTASLAQAGHAVYYTFGTLNWQELGLSDDVIGMLWAIGVIAEIVLFIFSSRIVARVGIARLFVLAGLAHIVRWTVLAFDPPLAMLIPLQALHGLTFGAAHLAAVHFIVRAVPASMAGVGQSLFAALAAGVVMGIMTLLAGPIYEALASKAFLAMSLVGLVTLGGGLVLLWRWDGSALIAVEEEPDHV